jgi:hypothetical protein
MSNVAEFKDKSVRSTVSPAEWQARVDLAASYRLADLYGMSDMIYTHVSAIRRTGTRPNPALYSPLSRSGTATSSQPCGVTSA